MKKLLLVIGLALSHFTYAQIVDVKAIENGNTTPPVNIRCVDSTLTKETCILCCRTKRFEVDSLIILWYNECKDRCPKNDQSCIRACWREYTEHRDSSDATYYRCKASCENRHITFSDYKSDNSIKNINEGNYNISIYPIPAQHKLFIQANTNFSGDVSVSIVNLLGAVVKKDIIPHQEGKLIFELNIEELSSGLYFIKVMGENLNHQSKVIVSN